MTAGNYIDRNLGRKGLHSTATDVSDMSPKIKDQNVESMKESLPPTDYIVTLQCADQPGVVHAMTTAILSIAGNIIENQQYTDPKTNTFVMRTRFESTQNHESTTKALNAFLSRFTPKLKIRLHADKPKVLLMVTKESHCLRDLLYLYELGELKVEIPVVVSNQIYLKELVESHGLKFLHMPITKENKLEQEEAMTELMNDMDIDFVVLARYMQIISEGMCNRMESRIINIHHSFLPGFKGARPYHQAHERGVKLIGATAHFVTGIYAYIYIYIYIYIYERFCFRDISMYAYIYICTHICI
jgi:formyltetrahydrofolate deformylase